MSGFLSIVNITVLQNPRLVESVDVEPWIQRTTCKVMHGFLSARRVGTPNSLHCSRVICILNKITTVCLIVFIYIYGGKFCALIPGGICFIASAVWNLLVIS